MKCPVCPEGDCGCPHLILRLVLGALMFAHGAQKVFGWWGGHGLSATVAMFTNGMHFPVVVAYLPIAAEFLGGLALIFGLFTRLAVLAIGIEMAVAVALVHFKNGLFMNWGGNQPGEGFEYHLLVIAICLALLIMGGGRYSIDRCMCKGRLPNKT